MNRLIFYSSFLIILASIFFVVNDAIINYLSPRDIQFYHFIFYGTPAYLIVPIYLLIIRKLKINLKCENYFIPLLRGILFLPLPYLTFITLKNISLPEYTTLNMSSPVFAVLISLFFLKEKFNIYILFSLIFGTVGVIFVIQPGFEAYNPYFLLVLLAAILITISQVIVNKYSNVTTALGFFIYGDILIHLLSFILFLIHPIKIDLFTFALITIASFLINSAIFLVIKAFHIATKYFSSLYCLIYTQILWSFLFGFFIFNEKMNSLAVLGAIFIVVSGIFSLPAQYKQIKS